MIIMLMRAAAGHNRILKMPDLVAEVAVLLVVTTRIVSLIHPHPRPTGDPRDVGSVVGGNREIPNHRIRLQTPRRHHHPGNDENGVV
jgi:hypothetical protein